MNTHPIAAQAADILIVALDHPSLAAEIDAFAAQLRNEQRFFGASAHPKPFPSLINRLASCGAIRLGAMIDRELIAISRVDSTGDTSIAVLAEYRGHGVGTALLEATIVRAGAFGHERIVLRSSRRSRAVLALGIANGAATVDQGCGRIDMIFPCTNVSTNVDTRVGAPASTKVDTRADTEVDFHVGKSA